LQRGACQEPRAVHVTPVYPGYDTVDLSIPVATKDVRRDVSATANQQQCVAPGYGYIAQADFEG
jgi:hypothetical protein